MVFVFQATQARCQIRVIHLRSECFSKLAERRRKLQRGQICANNRHLSLYARQRLPESQIFHLKRGYALAADSALSTVASSEDVSVMASSSSSSASEAAAIAVPVGPAAASAVKRP
jgi:exonuclease VII large subunit